MSTWIYRNSTISEVASRTEEEDYQKAFRRRRTWNVTSRQAREIYGAI